ncbi:MAG: DUF2007 domain-containing protein [Bacteroidaceae bacterium]|nr:DUF2007 domain-containing protein [Bacteroidaceae bacterium]
MADDRLVCVFKGQAFEAEVVKARLEDSGIPSMIQNDTLSAIFSTYTYMAGDVAVMVNSDDAEAARTLLDSENELTD